MDIWKQLNNRFFSGSLDTASPIAVTGGDISASYQARDNQGNRFFIKLHPRHELLEAESGNLKILNCGAVFCPRPLGLVAMEGCSALILPFITMHSTGNASLLGQQLAMLHRHRSPDGRYGLDRHNFIGASIQTNTPHKNWAEFWWQCRIQPQLKRASQNGFALGDTRALKQVSNRLLADHNPLPSLLHGDLWGGNKAWLEDGSPVLFDPATYYGDRETDIAFTRLFGGFAEEFYRSYQKAWPLPARWHQRQPLYNLYHLLNHLNLFGGSYLNPVHSAITEVERLAGDCY